MWTEFAEFRDEGAEFRDEGAEFRDEGAGANDKLFVGFVGFLVHFNHLFFWRISQQNWYFGSFKTAFCTENWMMREQFFSNEMMKDNNCWQEKEM